MTTPLPCVGEPHTRPALVARVRPRAAGREGEYELILPLRTSDHPLAEGMFDGEELTAMWELDHASPGPGWTASERAQPSIGLLRLYTAPAHLNVGRLASLWLADHVARTRQPPVWLRGSTPDGRFAAHISETWGWQPVRQDGGRHLLQLRPELAPNLAVLITAPPTLTAPVGRARPPALSRNEPA